MAESAGEELNLGEVSLCPKLLDLGLWVACLAVGHEVENEFRALVSRSIANILRHIEGSSVVCATAAVLDLVVKINLRLLVFEGNSCVAVVNNAGDFAGSSLPRIAQGSDELAGRTLKIVPRSTHH